MMNEGLNYKECNEFMDMLTKANNFQIERMYLEVWRQRERRKQNVSRETAESVIKD